MFSISDSFDMDIFADDVISDFYYFGYNYGFGFEHGPMCVGYKLAIFLKMIFDDKRGNQYDNIHTIVFV